MLVYASVTLVWWFLQASGHSWLARVKQASYPPSLRKRFRKRNIECMKKLKIDRGKDSVARRSGWSRKRRAVSACFDTIWKTKEDQQSWIEVVSLNVNIETKEKMTDNIILVLIGCEAHVSRLLQRIRDHQDTISCVCLMWRLIAKQERDFLRRCWGVISWSWKW